MVKPQGKEMKMQWITVDGRRTPIILPQIWDHEKEDWVVTSTENPLPTQLTGSNVEDEEAIPVRSTGRMKVVSNLENIEFSAGSSVYLRHLSEGIITDIDTITILLRWLDTEPDDYKIVVSYYSSGTTSNGVTMEDTYSKDILKKEIKLLSPYVSVYLLNKTTTDATIRTAIVTGG